MDKYLGRQNTLAKKKIERIFKRIIHNNDGWLFVGYSALKKNIKKDEIYSLLVCLDGCHVKNFSLLLFCLNQLTNQS